MKRRIKIIFLGISSYSLTVAAFWNFTKMDALEIMTISFILYFFFSIIIMAAEEELSRKRKRARRKRYNSPVFITMDRKEWKETA